MGIIQTILVWYCFQVSEHMTVVNHSQHFINVWSLVLSLLLLLLPMSFHFPFLAQVRGYQMHTQFTFESYNGA
jgi:hypothetical protein